MTARDMLPSDEITSASVVQFPLGWWVTAYAGPTTEIHSQNLAHRLQDTEAYYVLYRVTESLPTSLGRTLGIVRKARRELRSGHLADGYAAWLRATMERIDIDRGAFHAECADASA